MLRFRENLLMRTTFPYSTSVDKIKTECLASDYTKVITSVNGCPNLFLTSLQFEPRGSSERVGYVYVPQL